MSKPYRTARIITEVTTTAMAHYHFFLPCMRVMTDAAMRHYDFMLGCNPPASEDAPIGGGDTDWICSPGSRNAIISACMIPVGYHLHKKISRLTKMGLAGANQCFEFAINQYDQFRKRPDTARLHQLEESIFEITQRLIDQAEIIRTWTPYDRQVLFHLASTAGQLNLMKAVLKPHNKDEEVLIQHLDQLIDEQCSICFEDIN